MLRSGILDETSAARALEVIERNTTLLAQLIDDLLDLSRIVAGKLQLELRPVDLVGVIQAAIEAVRNAADNKQIALKVVVDSSAGPVVGDARRLQQVVWNLLSNAIKFTPQHGVIELILDQGDDMARITVRDSGGDGQGETLIVELPVTRGRLEQEKTDTEFVLPSSTEHDARLELSSLS